MIILLLISSSFHRRSKRIIFLLSSFFNGVSFKDGPINSISPHSKTVGTYRLMNDQAIVALVFIELPPELWYE